MIVSVITEDVDGTERPTPMFRRRSRSTTSTTRGTFKATFVHSLTSAALGYAGSVSSAFHGTNNSYVTFVQQPRHDAASVLAQYSLLLKAILKKTD